MIHSIVGSIEMPAAMMLSVLFVAVCVVLTAAIVRRRSSKDLDQAHELAKIKEANSQALALVQGERNQEVKKIQEDHAFQLEHDRISQNLIASHARDVSPGAQG